MTQDSTTSAKSGAGSTNPARATMYSIAIAAVLLVTTVLPAEHGIDWSGAGRVLGLTAMGEKKMAAAKSVDEANAANLDEIGRAHV